MGLGFVWIFGGGTPPQSDVLVLKDIMRSTDLNLAKLVNGPERSPAVMVGDKQSRSTM